MILGEKYKYRWVVLCMAAVINGLTWGLLYSIGVIYSSWLTCFNEPASYVSVAGSLPLTIGSLGGPLFRPTVNKLGLRVASFFGGVLMGAGIAVSHFAESVLTLCFTFGLVAGFGAGLANFSASVAVNEYFYRERSLAEGIMGAGLCVGMFLLSMLQQLFIETYTWQGTMLLTGGLCTHICLASLFFIPPNEVENHPLNIWRKSNLKLREEPKIMHEIEEAQRNNLITKKVDGGNPADKKGRWDFVKIWCDPRFILIIASDFLSWVALYVPYVHLVERARTQDISESTSAWLSPVIGFGGLLGRPLVGFAADFFKIHPFWAYTTVQMLCGIGTFLSPFWSSLEGLFVFAVYFGLLSSGYGFIKASAAKILGPTNYMDAFSWMLLFEGIGTFLGPTVGGAIFDVTQSYDWTFRFAGACLIISAAICVSKPLIDRQAKNSYIFRQAEQSVVN
uniref:monocarboxylate transporter 2-like n=1 Tax=Ciona intestinalis TaxID=7719 RepID=UPI00089DA7C2|nr:monocarboxylate transporter 2-like [Ciona intestinalis]|eukprot:XP_004225739.2 monocarboxylate transporter 2-like [Ciona intestinalis]